MRPLQPPELDRILAARERIRDNVVHSPLLRLDAPDVPGDVYLKLECLQPIGSFKIRGAASAITALPAHALSGGVVTASAGNMAQGVAWMARQAGVPCHVVVPDHAPRRKVEAIHRLGGTTEAVPFDRWWRLLCDRGAPGLHGRFIHPVSDPEVVSGNGTIALELAEDLPDFDAVVVPFGGGGLSCGIASGLRAVRPGVPVYAAEVSTAAPLAASLAAGRPVTVPYTPSFVDGIGSSGLLQEMWPMARDLLAGSVVVDLDQVTRALRLLVEFAHVVAEGAGAAALAAALTGEAGSGATVVVVSGGNIDAGVLARLLRPLS